MRISLMIWILMLGATACSGSDVDAGAATTPPATSQVQTTTSEDTEEVAASVRGDIRRIAESQERFFERVGRYAPDMRLLGRASGIYNPSRIHEANEFATCSYEDDQQFVVAARRAGSDVTWYLDSGGDYEPTEENPRSCELGEFEVLEFDS